MEWIDINERRPEPYQEVLCYYECDEIGVDYVDDKGNFKDFPLEPTYWCVPSKPKGIYKYVREGKNKLVVEVQGDDLNVSLIADTLINSCGCTEVNIKPNI